MMEPDAPSVPIIQHPDVRRMLLNMKAYVEGMRSLLYYVAVRGQHQRIRRRRPKKPNGRESSIC
jgi:alkylation response protein AidB-like acyl-CoA dehydrogenase